VIGGVAGCVERLQGPKYRFIGEPDIGLTAPGGQGRRAAGTQKRDGCAVIGMVMCERYAAKAPASVHSSHHTI
jgi:hypothetical protein